MGELCLFLLTGHPVVFGAHPPPLTVLQVPEIVDSFGLAVVKELICGYIVFWYLRWAFVFMPPIVVYHLVVFLRSSIYI